jgi:hypothetical protein
MQSIVRFRAGRRQVCVDLPHLLVLVGIVGFCAWYLQDTRAASLNVQNLMLIEPAAILAFACAVIILRDVVTITAAPAGPFREGLSPSTRFKILGSMATLGCYVGAMPYLGFDVATALYVCASLLVLGERRIVVLLTMPIVFSVVTILLFRQVVSIPLPLFFG